MTLACDFLLTHAFLSVGVSGSEGRGGGVFEHEFVCLTVVCLSVCLCLRRSGVVLFVNVCGIAVAERACF